MATRRVAASDGSEPDRARPATTPEGREAQLVAMAYDLAEKRLRTGEATSQEVTHFLKMGSRREALEQERLRGDISLNKTKQEILESEKRTEALYAKAISQLRRYSGAAPLEEGPDGQ